MTTKVQISTECSFCKGAAYFPSQEAVSYTGEHYTQYESCLSCRGTGRMGKWITLAELARLINQIDLFEPDYDTLAEVEPISNLQDNYESSGLGGL